jgi:hypothetical protein
MVLGNPDETGSLASEPLPLPLPRAVSDYDARSLEQAGGPKPRPPLNLTELVSAVHALLVATAGLSLCGCDLSVLQDH